MQSKQKYNNKIAFKILNGFYNIQREKFLQFDSTRLGGHDCKLFKKRFRLDVKKFSYCYQVVEGYIHSENSR